MERIENGLAPQTWAERVAAGITPGGACDVVTTN
jgi:hypothetical protein